MVRPDATRIDLSTGCGSRSGSGKLQIPVCTPTTASVVGLGPTAAANYQQLELIYPAEVLRCGPCLCPGRKHEPG